MQMKIQFSHTIYLFLQLDGRSSVDIELEKVRNITACLCALLTRFLGALKTFVPFSVFM